jgi:Tol biopolymer transport system component
VEKRLIIHKVRYWLLLLFLLPTGSLIGACTQTPAAVTGDTAVAISLTADGETFNLTSEAPTVRELLAEAGITLGELDEVSPPLFTPLTPNMAIQVVRVREQLEIITETIPFERKFVRTDTMEANDPPQIVQAGRNGEQEVTVRIVFRDGLEAERIRMSVTPVTEPREELVMIGIGASRGSVSFPGTVAFISGSEAIMMRGTTAVPEQLNTGGGLDGRVFTLSPTGSHLLYTRTISETSSFNNALFVIRTDRSAQPRPLGVENVLWAGWNPARTDLRQIAYTTADPTSQPPGWEARNDLWLADLFENEGTPFNPQLVIDAYPALNGWWGGNYAWSPTGERLAYAYADEVGLVNPFQEIPRLQRRQLQSFPAYNTRADWVWVPTPSWSPDGRFVAFTQHNGLTDNVNRFDSYIVDIQSPLSLPIAAETGMWGHFHWTPAADDAAIAFLRALDPLDSLRSNYALWLMDRDGSNSRQIYPPPGENSAFSRDQYFMAWGPDNQQLAFIFAGNLFIYDRRTDTATQVTSDDILARHPVWAPYGAGLDLNAGELQDALRVTPTPQRFLPDE